MVTPSPRRNLRREKGRLFMIGLTDKERGIARLFYL